ncbi:MAG: quinone-dependent dihydroorotate dehydrogenase [Bernardetiaceae bacterium]|nr:quinone-dependent dihydroorotate dehydrogenase [Bernardetiaceae bacterium]
MYKSIIRPILFKIDPEWIHNMAFKLISIATKLPITSRVLKKRFESLPEWETDFCGLKFRNPVGLAAGFDKDATALAGWEMLGFGFVEIGTLTPKPQPGNPKPRLFRFSDDKALINRMGFNNKGVEAAVKKLKARNTQIIIGGNIGKNKDTPNEEAFKDYEIAFDALFDYVDYFVVNVSSPNTPNLRELQDKEPLHKILKAVSNKNKQKKNPKPLLLKIAPDLNNSQLDDILNIICDLHIDGIIATNTTVSRDRLEAAGEDIKKVGSGGMSGRPLKDRSTEIIRYIHSRSRGSVPIIGVGGILSADDAIEKIEAGASLVQIYTGFVYEGPELIRKINKAICHKSKNSMPIFSRRNQVSTSK